MKTSDLIILVIIIAVLLVIGFLTILPAPKEDIIKIGAIIPLTGVESMQGELIRNGIVMAQEEINKAEGINEIDIELIIEDSKSDTKESISAYNFLKTQNISIILTIGSPTAMALSPLVNEDKIVLFSIAASPAYKSADDYTFRVIPSAEKEGPDMANLVFNELGIKKLGIIYQNNDFGVGVKETFSSAYSELGGTVLIEEAFDPTETDFRSHIFKIQTKTPEALYIGSWGKQAGIVARQTKEMGFDVQLLCGQACQNPDLITEGQNAVEGLIYPYTFINTETLFYNNYQEKYNSQPTQISERMYDIIRLSAKVLSECEDRQCVLSELYSVKFNGTSSTIMFDNNGDIIEDFVLYMVQDGKFVMVD